MRAIIAAWHRLVTLFRRHRLEQDFAEEVRFHLAMREEEALRAGAPIAEASLTARRRFGNVSAIKDRMRDEWTFRWLETLSQDVHHTWRTLAKAPAFTCVAVATLTLGIGATTALFSLVNVTLLQTLPITNRDRLVYVHRGNVGGVFSYPFYKVLRDDNHVLEGIAAWSPIEASVNADRTTDLINGLIVTGNLFDLLGVKAEQGRLLSPSDDVTPGAHPVVVISHELWHTRFAGRPDIVGHDVRLNGQAFTIVGVTPPSFPGPQVGRVRHLYVPMMMQALMRPPRGGFSGDMNPDLLNDSRSWLTGVARLKPGIPLDQVNAELASLATSYEPTTATPTQPVRVPLVPIDQGDPRVRGVLQPVALLLGGVVVMVLLIACTNLANLLLAKTAARRRELAVRMAVGATRARLVRQLLTESLVLSLIGGVCGLGLAWALVRLIQAAPLPAGVPFAIVSSIDRRVLFFSLGLSLFTGLLFGTIPAFRASRPGLVPALKDASATGDGRRLTLQNTLVIAEVALSMLLLIPAGLFVRSLMAARAIDPGVDVAHLLAAPLNINLLRYTTVQGRDFYRRIVEQVGALPGVEAASVARVPILGGEGRVIGIAVEGRGPYQDGLVFGEGGGVSTTDPARINANVVGPMFFPTLGIPLVIGRDFSEQDVEGRPPVVILNETAAQQHFGDDNPVGHRISFRGREGPWREIVGVVRDSKYAALGEAKLAVVYMPVTQNHETGMTLYARTSLPPASLIAAIRREIQALEPNLPVPNLQTMTDRIGASLFPARMGAWLLAGFGALALFLAAIGIYGVLSFSISRRTHEMGVRLALGAAPGDVFLLVIRDGMVLVVAGMVLGLGGAMAGVGSLTRFLYGVPPLNVAIFTTMIGILLTVAFVACIIPARRAMRVNPMAALRYE